MVVVYILIGLFIVFIAICVYIARTIFLPNRFSHEKCKEIEMGKGFFDENFLKDKDIQDHYIEHDGLKLYAQYVDNKSEKTIILMHGYTYTLYGSYKYLRPFLENNFNILMPDQRHHGKSEGKNTTLGYKEHLDLKKWIAYIKEINPKNKIIGLHGESMGAATSLLEGHNKDVDFVISDCSFSTFKRQVEEHLWNDNKIPKCFVYPASLMSKILFDAPILRVNPVNNIKNIKVPILLIHGQEDKYISTVHYNELKQQLKPTDSIYFCKGADHAESYETNPEKYNNVVRAFLSQHGLI